MAVAFRGAVTTVKLQLSARATTSDIMRAMVLNKTGLLSDQSAPLAMVELPIPRPRDGEILLKIAVCGVCHTDLTEPTTSILSRRGFQVVDLVKDPAGAKGL